MRKYTLFFLPLILFEVKMLFTQGDIFSHPLQSEQENYSNWIFKQPVNKYF